MALGGTVLAHRETGAPVTLMMFDDGWIDLPGVASRASSIRRHVLAALIIFVVGSGLLTVAALGAELLRVHDVGFWSTLVSVGSLLVVFFAAANPRVHLLVQGLLQRLADHRRLRRDPRNSAHLVRRRAGVPWYRKARSASEFAAYHTTPAPVLAVDLSAIRLGRGPAGCQATVWRRDGSMLIYRSVDHRLSAFMSAYPPTRVATPPEDLSSPVVQRKLLARPRLVWIGLAVAIAVAIFGLGVAPLIIAGPGRPLASAPDSAAQSRGGAERLTSALRAQGFACSDENIDPRLVSRLCSRLDSDRTEPRETVAFVALASSGDLQRVDVRTEYPSTALPDLCAVVADALGMTPPQRESFLTGVRAGQSGTFVVGPWGYHQINDASVELLVRTWRVPTEEAATLTGSLDGLVLVAESLGYACDKNDYSVTCTRTTWRTLYRLTAVESAGGDGLKSLYLWTRSLSDSQRQWAEEMTAILDRLPGRTADDVALWLRAYPALGGADTYVAGMRLHKTTGRDDHVTNGGVTTPCWPSPRGPFC